MKRLWQKVIIAKDVLPARSIPLISTFIFYCILRLAVKISFRTETAVFFQTWDFITQLLFAYVLFSFSRRVFLFLAAQLIMMSTIYIGHALKVCFLGAPLGIDDIYAFTALFNVLNSWQKAVLVFPFIGFPLLFVLNFRFRKNYAPAALLTVILLSGGVFFFPEKVMTGLEKEFDFRSWDQEFNYRESGGTLYLLYSGANFAANCRQPPSESEVREACSGLRIERGSDKPAKGNPRRNVVLLVMEGFWDPLQLRGISFNRDPWDAYMRDLWNQCGNSRIMSPVFGGNTANAEFEFLSGHPANLSDRGIVFETQLRNEIPALPRILASFGYETMAMHPYFASFWNRVNAYRRLGFNHYYSAGDFSMNDLNQWTLSDDSFLRQAAAKMKKFTDKQPKFVYLLTLSGHWPFSLNEQRRPPVITVGSNNELLARYVNMLYYNSRAVSEFIRYVMRKDPDTLLIVLGDHLPLLGDNFQAYADAGVLARSCGEFDAQMYSYYTGTPLMIIDGRNGPRQSGTVAMYELPGIILRLLNIPPVAAIEMFQPPEGLHIRPLDGMSLVLNEGTAPLLIRDNQKDSVSEPVRQWRKRSIVIDRDIVTGKQHCLSLEPKDVRSE